MKAIIIDDSSNAIAALRADIADYCPDIEVIGDADGVVNGAKVVRELNPELVFLDIQMGDGSGFDLLEILGEHRPKIIFTTSSNEHAIQAFRFSAIDYLLKPIDPEELQAAVKKAVKSTSQQIHTLKSHLKGGGNRIALNSQDKIQVIDIPDIVRCESSGSYTLFCTSDGEQVLVTRTLKEYDQLLSSQGFLRVHQSHLVNLDYVREFVKSDGGYLVMKDKSEVPVSSRKKSTVLSVLGELQ